MTNPLGVSLVPQYESLIDGVLDHHFGTVSPFLSAELVRGLRRNLLGRLEEGLMHPAGIGKHFSYEKNLKVRGDLISWIDKDSPDPYETEFREIIHGFVDYLNQTCYTGINDFEFHYAAYEAGSFYKRHKDQFQSDRARKFSLVCYLNEDWQTANGGNLVLYLEDRTVDIYPDGGRAVFFKSDEVEHEVQAADRMRLSIAGWLKRV